MGEGIFWGIILILIGFGLVIKIVFNIDFPIFKFIVAFFFILLGIKMLFGDFGVFKHHNRHGDVIFNERKIHGRTNGQDEYNVIFGKAEIDLRDVELHAGRNKLEINVVFGNANVILNKDVPVKIKSDVAFGGISLPDGDTGGFGSSMYISENFDENEPYLYIKASSVFGNMNVRLY